MSQNTNINHLLSPTFFIRQNKYLGNPIVCDIRTTSLHSGITGFSYGLKKRKILKAAIGEYSERLASIKSFNTDPQEPQNPKVKAFSLYNSDIISVPAKSIFLNFDLPIFRNVNIDELKNSFSDSCGYAAHWFSKDAIENGYLEFIERQSLIYLWLSRLVPKSISLNDLPTSKLYNRINVLSQTLEKFKLFNISIVEDVYVVCAIGFHDNAFSIACNASFDIEKSIEGCVNEFMMIFESSKNQSIGNKIKSDNVFMQNFYNTSIDSFKKEYDFLLNDTTEKFEISLYKNHYNKFPLFNSVKNFVEKFNVNVYATFVDNPTNQRMKVVKVFSPDCFPHMGTEGFDPNVYKICESLPSNDFPNKFKTILFA
ncbi:YcaO-like family protein [Cytobacillus solani]|uniref:YcaO-like family protein n=1 Tax=Cytobacillus solani TaxID=1637975 RepID=UPI00114E034D|nr:YcaO-like family protein [Cytobacillus solani]